MDFSCGFLTCFYEEWFWLRHSVKDSELTFWIKELPQRRPSKTAVFNFINFFIVYAERRLAVFSLDFVLFLAHHVWR